ncbi:MAG: hypothetical protein JSS75_12725 [Bacteroidetes bacterium]|nr:hypothetical protein [Bacteroidota bacterium]
MVRRSIVLFVFALCALPQMLQAQPTSGTQDSVLGGPLRPRRDTYIIVPFPSPARQGVTMTIQYYNHNAERTSLRIVDINDRTVVELQPDETAPNGIHSFPFNTATVATGTYFIRLTRYGVDGSQVEVQDERFIIIH